MAQPSHLLRKEIISDLIIQREEKTLTLYRDIPFNLRWPLVAFIDAQQWSDITPERSLELYKAVEIEVRKYSQIAAKKDLTRQRAVHINDAWSSVELKFGKNAESFTEAMSRCLALENELIFTYSSMKMHIEDMEEDVFSEGMPFQNSSNGLDNVIMCQDRLTANIQHVLEAMEKMQREENNMKNVCDETMSKNLLGEELAGCLQSSREKVQGLNASYTVQLQAYKQNEEKALMELQMLVQLVASEVDNLIHEMEAWREMLAEENVQVGPPVDPHVVPLKFQKFGDIFQKFNDLKVKMSLMMESKNLTSFYPLIAQMEKIQKQFFHSSLIVTVQPKDMINVENKGSKSAASYSTKKKLTFSTTVRLLGLESYHVFDVRGEICILSETDLNAECDGHPAVPCCSMDYHIAQDRFGKVEITFQDIRVSNFTRVAANNVYTQFVRMRYTVEVDVCNTTIILQTLSLPFMFHTGSNQILEHIGSRMWYVANADMYKPPYKCPETLSVEKVIRMLDNRLKYTCKGRRLRHDEKEFLKRRLRKLNDSDEVKLNEFVKDKLKNGRQDGEKDLPFSFYCWFHAVLNDLAPVVLTEGSITSKNISLNSAWEDGVIFGFLCEQMSTTLLMDSKVPVNTFLIRPCLSQPLYNPSSRDARAWMTVDFKIKRDGEVCVRPIPMDWTYIMEHGLYGFITAIVDSGIRIGQFIYGINKPVSELKKYGQRPWELDYNKDYKVCLKQIFNINLGTWDGNLNLPLRDCESEPAIKRKKAQPRQQQTAGSNVASPSGSDVSALSGVVAVSSSSMLPNQLDSGASPSSCSQGDSRSLGSPDVKVKGQVLPAATVVEQAVSISGSQWLRLGPLSVDCSQLTQNPVQVSPLPGNPVQGEDQALSTDSGVGCSRQVSVDSTNGTFNMSSTPHSSVSSPRSSINSPLSAQACLELQGAMGMKSLDCFPQENGCVSTTDGTRTVCKEPMRHTYEMESTTQPAFTNIPTTLADAREPTRTRRRSAKMVNKRGGARCEASKPKVESAPPSVGILERLSETDLASFIHSLPRDQLMELEMEGKTSSSPGLWSDQSNESASPESIGANWNTILMTERDPSWC